TYRLLYLLPGIDQLHSPFRWIFAVTLSVAVLAGLGADRLARPDMKHNRIVRAHGGAPLHKWFGWILLALGGLVLVGLLLSYVFYAQVEPLVDRILHSMALAERAFADARMFYSYQ